MSDCGCGPTAVDTVDRVLKIALALNATMFVVEVAAGWIGHSLGLIADGLDMLADAWAGDIAFRRAELESWLQELARDRH